MSAEQDRRPQETTDHHMPALGLSWALAQTADGALKLSRDVALAASSDNVNLLALESCEKFGATLAISEFAQLKMSSLLRKQSKTQLSKYLLAKIGYGAGGSIEALSASSEGVRFLCLASALLSSASTFDSANILQPMIYATADDKTKALIPTVFQIKDILEVIEPRVNRYRFLDDVYGYQALVAPSPMMWSTGVAAPSAPAVKAIVESFRRLSRVGDAETKSITFRTAPFAAWIAAFARMCVDAPPVVLDRDGGVLFDQQGSLVTVYASGDPQSTEIDIEISSTYGSSRNVIQAVLEGETKPQLATGMVSMAVHARLLLRELQLDKSLGARALYQALPVAVDLVKSTYSHASDLSAYKHESYRSKALAALYSMEPFPSDDVVTSVMELYLDPNQPTPAIKPSEEGVRITDLPLVRLWADEHRSFLEYEPEEEFLRRLAIVVADVLALSLLFTDGNVEETKKEILLLHIAKRELSPLFISNELDWQHAIGKIFQQSKSNLSSSETDTSQLLRIEHVLKWTLKLLGHEHADHVDKHEWVTSSFRGQVVLPSLILMRDGEIPFRGYACLTYLPGVLMLEDQRDRRFSYILSKSPAYDRVDMVAPSTTDEELNPFTGRRLLWQLSSKAEHLSLTMGWTFNKTSGRPLDVIRALSSTSMLGKCAHMANGGVASMAPGAQNAFAYQFLPPGANRLLANVSASRLAVYPLHGDEELKLLALAATSYMVLEMPVTAPQTIINRGACWSCLFQACLLCEAKYAIL